MTIVQQGVSSEREVANRELTTLLSKVFFDHQSNANDSPDMETAVRLPSGGCDEI